VEVVRGREAVRHRFLQLQLAAQREVLGFAPLRGQRHVVSAEENLAEAAAMRRGVHYRVVVERASLDHGDLLAQALDAGQEITVVDSLPIQLVIADNRIAMVPLTPIEDGTDPGAVIIHEGGLLEALVALFHACRKQGWRLVGPEQARPGAEPADGPDEVDQSILGLLNIGLTDATIARQLGLSYRTIQRRISRLMHLAGAQTRFQLGTWALHAGWLGAVEDRPAADHRAPSAERSDDTGPHR
jgi:DNA-binding CsgD family transcriptional regulator